VRAATAGREGGGLTSDGWTLSLYEYEMTIPTLWSETKKFIQEHPEHIHKNNALEWMSDNGGESYNLCHFWSNFEIGDLNFWRSDAYMDYFNHLEKAGGFYYERWGDAPVHSIAAALFLDKNEIHWFQDIGE
jgi:alpha 1,2-mannosyltransferase